MPTFELTARHQIDCTGGLHIERGLTFSININMMGIKPTNLFGNSRCADQLVKQFQLNGIDVPKNDTGVYSRGAWDIKISSK